MSDLHVMDSEVDEVVGRLRAAYADLLASIGAETAIDVERGLGINKKLAWQVFRAGTADQPLSAGSRAPGEAATRQVLAAARRRGVAMEVVAALEQASRVFTKTIGRHADDRSSFDLMVSAVTGDGLSSRDKDLKRAAFRANRQLIGKYCDADVFTLLAHPGETPGQVHMCSLRGLVNLHRLRPQVPLEISRHRFDSADGSVTRREPIDENGDSIALLREFCSEPIPEIRQETCPDGFVRFFAESGSLGLQSATTCFLADIARNTPLTGASGEEGAAIGHIHEAATPSRVLLHDCFIDERLVGSVTPEVRVITNRRDAGAWPADNQSVLLPVQERVERIGMGPAAAATSELASYPRMVEHLASRLGWDASRLVLFRMRVEFPVLDSVVWVRFDLSSRS